MSWVKENKFLTTFSVVMVLGVGALGYKLYAASGAADDATALYNTKASNYNRLRRLGPFPSRDNLAKIEAQKKEALDVISAFQGELAKREFPVDSMSPERFQDTLKKAVTDVRAEAAAANIQWPAKFFLGFDRYETAPPDKDATGALSRQLKAIEWVIRQMISTPVMELRDLKRPEIPEEKGGKPVAKSSGKSGLGGTKGSDLVTSNYFEITIVCKQRQLAQFLNTVISPTAPQFFIPRAIRINNQNQKGPPRQDPNAAPATPPQATPAPTAPTGAPGTAPAATPAPAAGLLGDIVSIVGDELVDVVLRLEIVDFAEPSAPVASSVK